VSKRGDPGVVYVSIGSNLERERNVAGGLSALVSEFGELVTSSVYETEAVGHSGHPYYNLVAMFTTTCSVGRLREILQRIEAEHGRERGQEKFADRTLDIDILIYGDLVGQVEGVELPRGEILEQLHVLHPLAEIAGSLRLPGSELTVAEIRRAFTGDREAIRGVPFTWRDFELPDALTE